MGIIKDQHFEKAGFGYRPAFFSVIRKKIFRSLKGLSTFTGTFLPVFLKAYVYVLPLAQEILERMQRTFQRMQFIVSTHSPLVLTNFRQNSEDCILYSLQRENNFSTSLQKIDHSFGIDYNSLLVNLMGTKVRNSLLQQLIDSYLYWRTADEHELAEKAMDGIIDMVGPNSTIVEQLQSRS